MYGIYDNAGIGIAESEVAQTKGLEMPAITDTNKVKDIISRYPLDEQKIIHQIQYTFSCTRTKAIELYRANK